MTAPSPSSPLARGSATVRLGDLDAGPVATASRGGVVTIGRTRVTWWVGAEDRWHVPSDDASTRDQLDEGTPVVETRVRIPSGDAVGRVAVTRVEGLVGPSIVIEVENASPLPVAFAWIVESSAPLHGLVGEGGHAEVDVVDVGRLVVTRPGLGWAHAAGSAQLRSMIEEGETSTKPPASDAPGALAVLVPLPHTARAVATFTLADTIVDTERRDGGFVEGDGSTIAGLLADRERVPSPARVVAGWRAHLNAIAKVDISDRRASQAFDAAVCDVLLGASPDTDAAVRGALIEGGAVLGRPDLDGLVALVGTRKLTGKIPGRDAVTATAQFLRAYGATWSAIGDDVDEVVVGMLGDVAASIRWLMGRSHRAAVNAAAPFVGGALRSVVGVLGDLDQPDLARHVGSRADKLGDDTVDRATLARRLLGSRADGLSWGGVDASASYVLGAVQGMAVDCGDRLALGAGWVPDLAGSSIEAHRIPTRWGQLSFGLRWHGSRPALLWEVHGDGHTNAPLLLTAPVLDPSWSSSERSGETLLSAPDLGELGVVPEPVKRPVTRKSDSGEDAATSGSGSVDTPSGEGLSFS